MIANFEFFSVLVIIKFVMDCFILYVCDQYVAHAKGYLNVHNKYF